MEEVNKHYNANERGIEEERDEEVDVESDEEYDEQGYENLDEQILRRIEDNDPNINSQGVHWHVEDFANRVDWRKKGHRFGENTHLKKLEINFLGPSSNYDESDDEYENDDSVEENFDAFCEGLARNRSIEHLVIGNCCTNGKTFAALSSVFKHNLNLRHLTIIYCSVADGDGSLACISSR